MGTNMATVFVKIDQTVWLDDSPFGHELIRETQSNGADLSLSFATAGSGRVGFRLPSSSWVEGGMTIEEDGKIWKAQASGIAKIKIYELDEIQLALKVPLYIAGVIFDVVSRVVPTPIAGSETIMHHGQQYPLARVFLGLKKSALALYQPVLPPQ